MTRLHVGCGRVYLPGWINVDNSPEVKADVHADMAALPFEPGSVDLIYACHVLEHTHRHMVNEVLRHWHSLLKPGAVLRVAVPDFAACVDWYNKTGDLCSLAGLLWGGQDYPGNFHFIGFDFNTLVDALTKAGFKCCWRYDWRYTSHAEFDDFSQAYLPHMDKTNGRLMSLNMEASA